MSLSRSLIYLSVLSLPGAEELGVLWLTFGYLAFALTAPLLVLTLQPRKLGQPLPPHASEGVLYCCLLIAMLGINFAVGRAAGIPADIWLARSVHLVLLPSIYLCFTLERVPARVLFQDICVVGALEVVLIYGAALGYRGEDEFRRATDIEGVIVYSVFLVCTAFFAIRRFTETRALIWLLAYLLIALAAALTGTRVLLFSIGLLLLALPVRRGGLIVILIVFVVAGASIWLGDELFSRFNLAEEDNVITIVSKIEELQWLGRFFIDSPVVGQGFGREYQVSVAGSAYTYSHNMLMFYLGYSGLLGFALAMYPLVRCFLVPGFRLLIVAVLVFYTSATTYTNTKHSLFMAIVLLAAMQSRHSAKGGPAANLPLAGCAR